MFRSSRKGYISSGFHAVSPRLDSSIIASVDRMSLFMISMSCLQLSAGFASQSFSLFARDLAEHLPVDPALPMLHRFRDREMSAITPLTPAVL